MNQGFLFIMVFLLLEYSMQAQSTYEIGDLSLDKNNEEWFDQQIGLSKTAITIGKYENINIGARFEGTKFWVPGQVSYRNEVFNNVGMIYNAETDQLVIQHPDALAYPSEQFLPFQNQIQWFEVGEHLFRYSKESILNSPKGFFEEIYRKDDLAFLAKRINKLTLSNTGESYYEAIDQFIIQNGANYQRYLGKGSLLKSFPEYKKEIRQFARVNKMKLSRKKLVGAEMKNLFVHLSSLSNK